MQLETFFAAVFFVFLVYVLGAMITMSVEFFRRSQPKQIWATVGVLSLVLWIGSFIMLPVFLLYHFFMPHAPLGNFLVTCGIIATMVYGVITQSVVFFYSWKFGD